MPSPTKSKKKKADNAEAMRRRQELQQKADEARNAVRLLAIRRRAEGQMTVEAIARECGVPSGTMRDWVREPAFKKAVSDMMLELYSGTVNEGLARREIRIAQLQDLADRIAEVIRARAAFFSTRTDVPGAASGMLAMNLKGVGAGPRAEVVEEYKYDESLVKSLAELQKQIAEELGQRTSKTELSGPGGEPLSPGAVPPQLVVQFVQPVEAKPNDTGSTSGT